MRFFPAVAVLLFLVPVPTHVRQKIAIPMQAFTARVSKGQGFSVAHVEWLLEWGAAIRDGAARERLMESRPYLSPHAEMSVVHRVRDGAMAPEAFSLRCRRPFDVERRIPPWLAQIVSQCDGRTTWREQLGNARDAGLVPTKATSADFLTVLDSLVSQGLLWVSDMPLPGVAGSKDQLEGAPSRSRL